MALRMSTLLLVGVPALFLFLCLSLSSAFNIHTFLYGYATSVSICPVCSMKASETNSYNLSVEDSTKKNVGNSLCTPAENATELKLQRFVYVYDLGPQYTTDVMAMKPTWYGEQYDGDRLFTEALMGSDTIRTTDPEVATLFYVPFYAARFTNVHFKNLELDMAFAINRTSEVSPAFPPSFLLAILPFRGFLTSPVSASVSVSVIVAYRTIPRFPPCILSGMARDSDPSSNRVPLL